VNYLPPWLLRSPHAQSALASIPIRRPLVRRRVAGLLSATEDLYLDCGGGVTLLAAHSAPQQPNGQLVLLIHGWEGSADSMYLLTAAQALLHEGYRVVRLNLRDHGGTQHLNEGIFHSCRLDEAIGAARAVAARFPGEALNLGGFSLGGNFALRVAAQAPRHDLAIRCVAAVCPVLDPAETMIALEHGPRLYHWYFLQKWRRSLRTKRAAFPQLYEFRQLEGFRSLMAMTAHFVERYTEYQSLDAYLAGYAITGERLAGLATPSVMLLAEDDPVIPIAGLARVVRPPALDVVVSQTGGHCGFLQSYGLRSWTDTFICETFSRS
jgi:predicted alpha/beta-fold hydrolase